MTLITKTDLLSLNGQEITALMGKMGQKPYRAQQLFHALHRECIDEIAEISCLPKDLREKLGQTYEIYSPKIKEIIASEDGTRKYVFKCFDGQIIESVFIPGSSNSTKCTLCISSQVGCAMNCAFCATAKLGFTRNLLPSEIIGQVYGVLRDLKQISWAEQFLGEDYLKTARIINNIVYMGMGEPLNNYKNVVRSIELLGHEKGQLYASRRITVSTSGVVKNIARLGYETEVHLAVSLNAINDITRTEVMPVNKKWNIEDLLNACREYPLATRQRLTFQYVMMAGVNDSDEDAHKLVALMKEFQPKINLIPFNPHPFAPYKKPEREQVLAFQQILFDAKLSAFIRNARGDDINAACGMLAGNNNN